MCPSSGEPTQNLITAIFLSDKTVEEIKLEHKKLSKVRNDENNFEIYCDALPFDFSIIQKISNGEIRFPVSSSIQYPIKARAFNPLTLKVTSTQEWREGSTYYVLKASDQGVSETRKKMWDIVYQQNNFVNRFGFPDVQQLIRHYLKIKNYSYNVTKDFEITIPPFVKIDNVQFLDKQVTINIQNPSQLNNLQLNLKLERDRETVWLQPCEIKGTDNSLEVKINEMLPFDSLTIELIHRDSGLTLDRTYKKAPLENVAEPFVKTLDAFCSLDKLQKMLFEPEKYGKNPAKIFENAVTWLLSLAGFETVHLGKKIKKFNGKEEQFDKLQSNGYHIGSADIIAYEENERILLIDCDIGTVDPQKVQKLAELKKHFRENLKGYEKLPIVPILFTPKDFTKTPPSIDVMIAHQSVIKRIFEAVVKGDREQARSLLYYSGS